MWQSYGGVVAGRSLTRQPTFATKLSHKSGVGGKAGRAASGVLRLAAGGATAAELEVGDDAVVAAGGGHGGGDVPERDRVAEGGVDDEVHDRAAGLADQVRVRPGVAAVVAVALADAQFEHLADALEHVDRLVDRGEAGGG